jgi:hypothetical protein
VVLLSVRAFLPLRKFCFENKGLMIFVMSFTYSHNYSGVLYTFLLQFAIQYLRMQYPESNEQQASL